MELPRLDAQIAGPSFVGEAHTTGDDERCSKVGLRGSCRRT